MNPEHHWVWYIYTIKYYASDYLKVILYEFLLLNELLFLLFAKVLVLNDFVIIEVFLILLLLIHHQQSHFSL